MKTFDTISDAREGIMDFRADHWGDVPEKLRPRFRTLSSSPSPVDQIVGIGEFIWANREELTESAWDLGGGLMAFATVNAWHGLLEGNRGNDIVLNFRHALGEDVAEPSVVPAAKMGFKIEDDPAPVPELPQE